MRLLRFGVLLSSVCVLASGVHAQEGPFKSVKKAGVTLKVRAYTTPTMPIKYASRYDLEITKTPKDGFQWDYTVPDEPQNHYKQMNGFSRNQSFNNKNKVTIRATLNKYKIYQEKLVFKDFNLFPNGKTKQKNHGYGRILDLKEPRTLTTPSGISVTLLARPKNSMGAFGFFDGNANALFIALKTSPSQKRVMLPKSPLYRQFGKTVTIALESMSPYGMVSVEVDNTDDMMAVGFRGLYEATKIDALTIIVRQRVDLQAIPVAIEVPVERPAKNR